MLARKVKYNDTNVPKPHTRTSKFDLAVLYTRLKDPLAYQHVLRPVRDLVSRRVMTTDWSPTGIDRMVLGANWRAMASRDLTWG